MSHRYSIIVYLVYVWKNDSYSNSLVTERNLNSFKMEPGESNPADEGQNSNENDSPTEKIKSKLGIYIFNLQNWTETFCIGLYSRIFHMHLNIFILRLNFWRILPSVPWKQLITDCEKKLWNNLQKLIVMIQIGHQINPFVRQRSHGTFHRKFHLLHWYSIPHRYQTDITSVPHRHWLKNW